MQIEDSVFKNEEKVSMLLREMYRLHGYSCFKMNKFEEYDLYSQNKDFLVSDSVITFNDTNGKLMALKPDVTLSIVKNFKDLSQGVQRVYYNENVYRISDKTHSYKEIMQTGLECLGDITEYDLFEVIGLAAESLKLISENCVLNISNLDILSAALADVQNEHVKTEILNLIGEKNLHGLQEICERYAVPEKTAEFLSELIHAYGEPTAVANTIRAKTDNAEILTALERLETTANYIKAVSGVSVRVDLSLTNDMNYYNGLVFRGFAEGIPTGVLSGGQYDRLMTKMGKSAGAIGFAVYLDLLERLKSKPEYDVDVLLIYQPQDDQKAVHRRVAELISEGKSVSAQTVVPQKLVSREVEYFAEKGEDK